MSNRRNHQPGPGWSAPYPVPVYEHASGARVHAGGLLRWPDGSTCDGTLWPESREFARFVHVNGGNRKRGAMAWARAKMEGCNA